MLENFKFFLEIRLVEVQLYKRNNMCRITEIFFREKRQRYLDRVPN